MNNNIENSYLQIKIEPIDDQITNLFKQAVAGNWPLVIYEVKNKPALLQSALEGKTLLWIAAFQLIDNLENEQNNFSNLFDLIDLGFPMDYNASPLNGEHEGKSVFWLLTYYRALKLQSGEDDDGNYPNAWSIMDSCLIPGINFNAAPKIGPFANVTAFCLLTHDLMVKSSWSIYFTEDIADSALPPFENSNPCNVIYALIEEICARCTTRQLFSMRMKGDLTERNKKIVENCYCSLIKIIENNPECNVNFADKEVENSFLPQNGLETILALPSSPLIDLEKLLVYLIFAGAKITDSAQQHWKNKYYEIHNRLKSAFQKSFIVCNDLSHLVKDLRHRIALDILFREVPELIDFPREKLIHGLKFLHK